MHISYHIYWKPPVYVASHKSELYIQMYLSNLSQLLWLKLVEMLFVKHIATTDSFFQYPFSFTSTSNTNKMAHSLHNQEHFSSILYFLVNSSTIFAMIIHYLPNTRLSNKHKEPFACIYVLSEFWHWFKLLCLQEKRTVEYINTMSNIKLHITELNPLWCFTISTRQLLADYYMVQCCHSGWVIAIT